MRDGAEVARRAHNPKVVGSNPAPATKQKESVGSICRHSFFFYLFAFTSHLSGKNAKPLYYFYTQCCIHAMAQQREASTDCCLTFATRFLSLVLALPSVVRSSCNAQPNHVVYPSKPPWFWMKTVGVLVQKYGTFGCKVWWLLGREYCGLGKPIICFLFRNR